MIRSLSRTLGLALLLIPLLALLDPSECLARVGGGGGFSGGGGGGGGRGGGGSGGGGGGELVYILIRLCIQFPQVGIPVSVIALTLFVFRIKKSNSTQGHYSSAAQGQGRAGARRVAQNLEALKIEDPSFSVPVFLDFVQLVYSRGHRLQSGQFGSTQTDALLMPFFSQKGLLSLRSSAESGVVVQDVIFGSTQIEKVRMVGSHRTIEVRFETNLVLRRGKEQAQYHMLESWEFRRRSGAVSPAPERMRSLCCAACGSVIEARSDGSCPSCDQPRSDGSLQWQVSGLEQRGRKPIGKPSLDSGGVEAGTRLPTVFDPALSVARRRFNVGHADNVWTRLQERIEVCFITMQKAWSNQDWGQARAYQTDALFQMNRFWMERYKSHGLANRLDEVKITKVEVCKIELDAWYESITLRVHATMIDWTELLADSRVVAGNKHQVRVFSEYWTLLRSVKHSEPIAGPDCCPSCGAKLDNVSMSGVCGYCEAKLSGGDFDWVVSRIEQDEAYGG